MKLILHGIFFLFLLNTRSIAQVNQQDSAALVDLYNATGGSSWTNHSNWLVIGQPVTEWEGIVISGNRVISISLSNNNLNGTIPSTIGDLNAVTVLDLSGNALTGQLPAGLNNLTAIESLNLSSNNFTNTLPSFGNLTNLSFCELQNNNLLGGVPDFSGNSFLFYLDLSFNSLSGALPALTVSNTPELFYINLSGNNLTGNIPASFGEITNLETIKLNENELTGTIPSNLGSLINLALLDLSNNLLAGSIPATFNNLGNLGSLALHHNQLTGDIPAGLGNIPGLSDLALNHNQLSGSIPSNFCSHSFESLLINNNQFTFDGMECLDGNSEIGSLNYANQKILSIVNDNLTLSVTAGGTQSKNKYTWYKSDVLFNEKTGDPTLTVTEQGTYRVEVANSDATQLMLNSSPIIVSILPLTWLNFTASSCSENVCLQWETENEQNTSHFEIERSIDGSIFEQISTLSAQNNPGKHTYSTTDYSAAYGTNYYRIKQVDIDGRYAYSNIIGVKVMNAGNLTIRPNPANNFIMLSGIDKAERVTLYSITGQVLRQWQHVNGSQQLNISDLQKGMYIVKVLQHNAEAVHKIIKQ
ncbi:T9SS type A sorting domain-containing protein [Agriterribacter sp.]|uniref:T9SS type A sorting domain-containing protein n=1 Tax=Agriterribacter sp. TaxID=2821509 RepID=UPI002CCDA460|nr:T9SS type A sorting domain-containing protein [Agriterribacter sp.]HTN07915.1 T9SS type A sorting domain-containing protein [Agriterribacter sp.]